MELKSDITPTWLGGTGCTAVLCRQGAVAGVDVRGGAPGTRETDLLGPGRLVQQVHGVLLSGGSAFGLDAAAGVMQYLEERGAGYTMGRRVIPIVPAAIIFDLNLLSDAARPGPQDAYAACERASGGTVDEGSVGAGTGATVAKGRGMRRAIKGGIGTASYELPGDIHVGAIIAVNAYGGVCDPDIGKVIAGPRLEDGAGMMDPVEAILQRPEPVEAQPGANTTIGVVATNATLSKDEAHYLARVSHDGLALGHSSLPHHVRRRLHLCPCYGRRFRSTQSHPAGRSGYPGCSRGGGTGCAIGGRAGRHPRRKGALAWRLPP